MILDYLNNFNKDNLTEEKKRRIPHQQQLQVDLNYAPLNEYTDKIDPVAKYLKVDIETMLKDYQANGYYDNSDWVKFPKGTIFTWVKTIEPDLYDIYRARGTKHCYIAVPPTSTVELFGEYPYKEGTAR